MARSVVEAGATGPDEVAHHFLETTLVRASAHREGDTVQH